MIRVEGNKAMHLLGKVENYLRRSGTPPTRFGREAARDPRLVFDLRNGREAGPRLASRVAAFIEARERELGR